MRALYRLEEIRALGVSGLDASGVPPKRREALARHGTAAWTQTIARMPVERRTATLLAFAQHIEEALNDAFDVLDILIADLFRDAERPHFDLDGRVADGKLRSLWDAFAQSKLAL